MVFFVKLDKWASPTEIEAENASEASEIALKRFPVCDCCDEATEVQWVSQSL